MVISMLLINKTLLEMSKGMRGWIVGIAAIKMLIMVTTVEFAKIVSTFLGSLFNPSMTQSDFTSAIFWAFVTSLVLVVGNVLLGEAEYYCAARARLSLRERIIDKLFKIDIANIETIGPVSAINTTGQGVENMQLYYSRYLPTLLFCVVSPIYLFWQLFTVSTPVAIMLSVIAVMILPANNIFKNITEKMKVGYWKSLQAMTSHYLENLRGLTTLKLFGRDEDKTESLREKVEDFNQKLVGVMRANFYSVGLTFVMIYVGIFISLIIACTELMSGVIDLSAALMILMLSFSFFASFRELVGATHNALSGVAAAQNIHALFEINTERKSLPKPSKPSENYREGIELKDVIYAYPGRPNVLKGVSVYAPKGKRIALVGSSGCGKSTIASLLLRFIDPSEGKIEIDGYDYLTFPPAELRKRISIVPQTVSLFSGSIADNLRIAKENATEAEMIEALKNVHLDEWVLRQPKKLDSDVGDNGAKLSGGQRQKLGIARALLSDAEYIVLDEATSSVDMDSEKEIWQCIDDLATRKTLIIISHRLSTIRNADIIYVFSKGEVETCGNHAELMECSDIYSTLVKEQDILENIGVRSAVNE